MAHAIRIQGEHLCLLCFCAVTRVKAIVQKLTMFIDREIVGVIPDIHFSSLHDEKKATVYAEPNPNYQLTFLMEIIDSESGDVLARAGDRTWTSSSGGDSEEWAEVERAAKYWAGLFRNWLDKSLGKAEQD